MMFKNVLERFGMMNTHSIDVVTFDFKGARVPCSLSCQWLYWLSNEVRLGAYCF